MTVENKVDVSALEQVEEKWAAVMALYLRARDSRSSHPVLSDTAAAAAVDRIDYDFGKLDSVDDAGIDPFLAAVRAKQLDRWVTEFLRANPAATVVHLGCGLDSRALRVSGAEATRWFDLDLPDVIELRTRIYPGRAGYHTIASPVMDLEWLRRVPADPPTLLVAEGLFMYLTDDELRRLVAAMIDHFGAGQLIVDAVAPWVARMSASILSSVRSGRDIARIDPRLRLLDDVRLPAHHAEIPVRRYRAALRVANRIPGLRAMARQVRCAF